MLSSTPPRCVLLMLLCVACHGGKPAATAASVPTTPVAPAHVRPGDIDVPLSCHAVAAAAEVEVSLAEDSNVRDVAMWYLGLTCRTIVVPRALEQRAHAGEIHGRITAGGAGGLLRILLDEMGLAVVAEGDDALVVVEKGSAGPPDGARLVFRAGGPEELPERPAPPETPATPAEP